MYLSSFLVVASKGNLLLHYVKSNNWTFRFGLVRVGVWL